MNIVEIKMPLEANVVIETLEKHGFEAYAVGGCIRDVLLGKTPADWDICTSAQPIEITKCFSGFNLIEKGIRYGTLTLILENNSYEITSYRVDGEYGDNRRPDGVHFVREIKDDLARRDFTINAMAYNPRRGFIDLFGGEEDLKSGTIRTVGRAEERFGEDALRIMRALRFASVLGFNITSETSVAMKNKKHLLKNIASERIAHELNKIITGEKTAKLLSDNIEVLGVVIPELLPMVGFNQNNPYHCYDVLTHTLTAMENAPREVVLRLAMLFHDIAKPLCYTQKNGTGHFYGHPQLSSEMASDILMRLKYDKETISAVACLVLYHDTEIKAEDKVIKRWLRKIGVRRLRQLLDVKRADTMAKAVGCQEEKLNQIEDLSKLIDKIIEENECFSLKNLAVNGKDLISIGIEESRKIGELLNRLLYMVIDGEVKNEREFLLQEAEKLISNDFEDENI